MLSTASLWCKELNFLENLSPEVVNLKLLGHACKSKCYCAMLSCRDRVMGLCYVYGILPDVTMNSISEAAVKAD
jgi:hypothetical protein